MMFSFNRNGEIEIHPTKYDGLSRYISENPIELSPQYRSSAEELGKAVGKLGLF